MSDHKEPNIEMKEVFNKPHLYDLHSHTQKKQAEFLLLLIKQYVEFFNIKPKLILDVGCGTGSLTKCICRDHFPEAKIVGVDISESMIMKAREDLPKNHRIEYLCSNIENFKYSYRFDLVYSNAAMHWIKNQESAYKRIYNLMNQKGILFVHQGYKGCYRELYEVTIKVLNKLGLSQRFQDLSYPLVYHTKISIKNLLEKTGFQLVKAHAIESESTKKLIDDFAEAALLPYRKQFDEKEDALFIKEFKKEAKKLTNINTKRLYFVSVKK